MTKTVPATCSAASLVTVDGVTVPLATILSEGKKDSSGVAIIDKDKVFYVASSATDIKDLISSLVTIIEKIALIATGIDAASNSPGGQTANITALTALKTQLNSSKDLLK